MPPFPHLIAVLLLAVGLRCHAGAAENAVGPVRIDIVEGVPDETSWNFKAGDPSETYAERAFGFTEMPTRYSPRGVKVDRGMPFLYRATAMIALQAGGHRLLLRSRTGSRLFIDGQEVLATRFPDFKADGHEEVPDAPLAIAPDLRYLRPGHFESLTNFVSDGKPHTFTLEAVVGLKTRRPELGEMGVFSAPAGSDDFRLLAPLEGDHVRLKEDEFGDFIAERKDAWRRADVVRRHEAAREEEGYWNRRHERAREHVATLPPIRIPDVAAGTPVFNAIDRFIGAKLEKAGVNPAPLTDDAAFLRRATLDLTGVIPTGTEAASFAADKSPDRRARAIDRLLTSPSWADHWVGYWQDVLAENPGILKPMLNNTGPFRWWIHEAFSDNRAMDRFATELVMMEGSVHYGGPGGFGVATENDVPMAQKAQIVAQAFLGMQMSCARCHDAPHHDFKQKDLFSLAAMLRRQPQAVPPTSSIPTNSHITIGRKVKVTLPPGSKVAPAWPFAELVGETFPAGVLRDAGDSRERLAALLTDPRNDRFAKVLVNRLWKRYFGWGLVDPVDDVDGRTPSHPELLDYLARELVAHGYDLRHIARLVLNSHAYQREIRADASDEQPPEKRLFAAQSRRRLSAEQLVDSMFVAAGKSMAVEEMNMDVDGRRPVKEFNNLGVPSRAWQFTSLSNERDRPALSLPRAQSVVDALVGFGWRESRQGALTVRDDVANVIQPATVGNGTMVHGRIARLSDDGALVDLALGERSPETFVHDVFLRFLSRPPTAKERGVFVELIRPGFDDRRTPEAGQLAARNSSAPLRAVSWSNHLNPEATRLKQDQERQARLGDLPTRRLRPEWRERAEDMVWSLVNSPEFVFVP